MADRNAPRREIGYVVMGFPRISETFISNEILQLEALGARLRVFAIKPGDEESKHESVARIRAPVEYLPRATSLSGTKFTRWLRENLPRFRDAHGRVLRARSLAYLSTLGMALAMCVRYRKSRFGAPRKVFIKEFLQAGVIADRVLADGTVGPPARALLPWRDHDHVARQPHERDCLQLHRARQGHLPGRAESR